jgi:glycerophosphoryl diester phosphodiesterase
MRLTEFFEALPPGIGVDLDVKTSLEDALRSRDRTTAGRVADLMRRVGGGRLVLVSSFDPSAVLIVRRHLPDLPVGLITWRGFPLRKAITATKHLGAQVVCANAGSFAIGQPAGQRMDRSPAELIRTAHAAGLEVLVWSATPAEEDVLIAAEVDCLVVDDVPAALVRHAERMAGSAER